MPTIYDDKGQRSDLTNPIASGGEGIVYAVPGLSDTVVKIYRKNPVPSEVRDKLDAMLANPPSRHATDLVWPTYLAKDQKGNTVGFFMPKLPDKSHKLNDLLTPNARKRAGITYGIAERLHIASNLATAVANVHASKDRAIGDVNESNIYVTEDGLVRILDTDSFQIGRFRCPVGKEEYTPPELQGENFANIDRTPDHDAFGLAVLIYLLLAEGQPPYVRSKNVSAADRLGERIKNHQYPPFTDSKSVHPNLVITGPYRNARASLPPNIRTAFAKAFNDKGEPRPTASEWKGLLADALKNVTTCPSGHQKFADPAACHECLTGTQTQTRMPQQPARQQMPTGRTQQPARQQTPTGRTQQPARQQTPTGRTQQPARQQTPTGRTQQPARQQTPPPRSANTQNTGRSGRPKGNTAPIQVRTNKKVIDTPLMIAVQLLKWAWPMVVAHPIPSAIIGLVAAVEIYLVFSGTNPIEFAVAPILGLIAWAFIKGYRPRWLR
jgi:DNA-binding helix-hairpin-helix protein with protein kinase domain